MESLSEFAKVYGVVFTQRSSFFNKSTYCIMLVNINSFTINVLPEIQFWKCRPNEV